MLRHIVLLQVALSVTDAEINTVLEKLGNLRHDSIPEILSFSYGRNCNPEGISRNYNFGFTMDFASEKNRDVYLAHTDHIRVAQENILPLLIDGVNSALAFDYVIQNS